MDRISSIRKCRMSLFQDEGVFDEVPTFDACMFTPGKSDTEQTFVITPVVKKDLSALLIDEDSGLGMENDDDGSATEGKPTEKQDDVCFKIHFRRKVKSDTDTPVHSVTKSKRPLSDEDSIFSESKRQKHTDVAIEIRRPKLKKTLSFGDTPLKYEHTPAAVDVVESVVDRLVDQSELISDGSRCYTLPTVTGKHSDLKNISPATMVNLLSGKYDDVIGDFKIIDCRYPYEYNGGHIQSAENLYTQEKILEFLQTEHNKATTNKDKASILIFHCEFSSERGPKLCRYLRAKDREINSSNYPALNYPEVYLLNGGYKEFFLSGNKQWCEPMEYKPMLDSQHTEELRHFRAKSKSWTAGERRHKRSQRLNF